MVLLKDILDLTREFAKQKDANTLTISECINQKIEEGLREFAPVRKPLTLYRFVSFPSLSHKESKANINPIINDILSGGVTLGNPANFNDPFDPILKTWADLQRKEAKVVRHALKDMTSHIRIGCFVREPQTPFVYDGQTLELYHPYENTLMWGHYAKGHRGICIKYKIVPEIFNKYNTANSKLCIGDVRYREHKSLSNDISFDNALLAKSSNWLYEHETRLIYFQKDISDWVDVDGHTQDYISLDGFCIEAVYMGLKISPKRKEEIIDVVKGRNIDLYEMDFDPYDITKIFAVNV